MREVTVTHVDCRAGRYPVECPECAKAAAGRIAELESRLAEAERWFGALLVLAEQRLAEAVRQRTDALSALRDLANKCEQVGEASSGIFTLAAVHGARYTGPNYAEELRRARALLATDWAKAVKDG